ncbi:MAG: galactokinase family protein [Armatimonadota bacterium]|nr:galactokinase family protein [Armatimonadota bacterium]
MKKSTKHSSEVSPQDAYTVNAVPMSPREILTVLEAGDSGFDEYLGEQIYANSRPEYLARQRERLAQTVKLHMERVGDKPTYVIRAPGRLNAFLEYLDMCAGDHMSTTIDGDIPVAVSPREDDVLNCANFNPLFAPEQVSVTSEFNRFVGQPWDEYEGKLDDNWDNRTKIYPHYGRPQGNWVNYVLSPYLRTMWELGGKPLRGADLTFGPATAPFRAGTSSSSAVVVLGFLAMYLCNRDVLPPWSASQVCSMLGEAEWYVGTHGGANDQTTILMNGPNTVLYNRHSRPVLESTPLPFLRGVHVVLANSLWEVNKSLTGNQSFNMRKGWMEIGDEIMKLIIAAVREAQKQGAAAGEGWLGKLVFEKFGFTPGGKTPLLESHPDYWERIEARYHKFGSLDETILGIPNEAIEELILLLPIKLTPDEAGRILGKDRETIEKLYTKPKRAIGGYHTRTTARFFHRENMIGRELERIFLEAEARVQCGELSPDSEEYDQYRLRVGDLVDRLQHALSFDFRVSNAQLDRLLDIARRGPGYLGGKLTGAGKGGCVSILVREKDSEEMCRYLDREYYSKPGNFDDYRQILTDALRYYEPGSFEHDSAAEQLANLDKALASIENQRTVITFSRGACALDFRLGAA